MKTRKISHNDSVLNALGIESVVEKPVPNKDGALANKEDFMNLHELILDNAAAVFAVLSRLKAPYKIY